MLADLTPEFPSKDGIPTSLPGCDIASYPMIHEGACYATYVACDPLHKDAVLARYAALGWTEATDEDYRNMNGRRARLLLLEAWDAMEKSGEATLADEVGRLFHKADRV